MAPPQEFNYLEKEKPCKKENFEFGLSLLHARIRFFENVLHLAYRLPVKKWNARLTGPDVVAEAILPIGQLSEEAAEARNKHIRMFRLNYARKFSRVACNSDVLNRLLLTSDPVLTGMRTRKSKNKLPLSADVLNLLLESDILNVNFEDDDENTE